LRHGDTYYLLVWRLGFGKDPKTREVALRKLAGHYRSWFRLQGCEGWKVDEPLRSVEEYEKDPSVPLPMKKRLDPPITGIRAPPSPYWKLDFLIWLNLWNTIFQAFLAGFMWGYNRFVIQFVSLDSLLIPTRFNRPSWTTGMFIGLAFGCVGAAGWVTFSEGKRVKKVEGVLPNPQKLAAQRQQKDLEMGLGEKKEPVGFAAALRKSMDKQDGAPINPVDSRV